MTFFDQHISCDCCGSVATDTFLDAVEVARLEMAVWASTGSRMVLRTEDNDAPFVGGEIRLTALLADNADRVANIVQAPILAALNRNYVDEDAILNSLSRAATLWDANAWPDGLNNETRQVLSSLALLGSHELSFGVLLPDLDRLRIINGMAASSKYYTNNYFNTYVFPTVADAAHSAVLNGRINDGGELEAIHALLNRRLRSVPYWNLVANAAASRAYHYGYIKAGILTGYNKVRYQATLDERTSVICQSLHGTVWDARDVSLLLDRIADARGEEIKQVAPWLPASQVAGLTPAELIVAGVVVPPIHGRCRSKLVFDF